MTRWGLLSDIHGNLPNLERALAHFKSNGVDRLAVLGDTLGRGDAAGCVARIAALADVSVVGNRDLDWQDRVEAPARAYVLGLPRLAVADGFVATHGDGRLTRDLASNDIRAGFRRARSWLRANDCRLWLFGHTHQARVWRLGPDADDMVLIYDVTTHGLPACVRLDTADPDVRWVVNVGSVGLPFPGKGPASAAIYDRAAGTVEFVPL